MITISAGLLSNFLSNLITNGPLNLLWGLVNSLQIIAYYPLLDVQFPANCVVYFAIIIKIATFDLISVDFITDWIASSYQSTITYYDVVPNFKAFAYKSTDPITNMDIIFLFAAGLVVLPILLKLCDLLFRCSRVLTKKIRNFKTKTAYWNLYLRFLLEVYLEMAIISLLRVQTLSFATKFDTMLTLFSICCVIVLMVYLLGAAPFLLKNHHRIKDESFSNRFGALVEGFQPRDKVVMYTPTAFMARRFIYAMMIVFLANYNFLQI